MKREEETISLRRVMVRKYEVRVEDYELDTDMAKALNAIPEARKILETAVKWHEEISPELKRRVFSPKCLKLQVTSKNRGKICYA